MYNNFEQFINSFGDDDYIDEYILPVTILGELNLQRLEFEQLFNKLQNLGWPIVIRSDVINGKMADNDNKDFLASKFGYTKIKNPASKDGRWIKGNVKFSVYTLKPDVINHSFIAEIEKIFFKIAA